jgi:penicillin-binding protein-related factor A (putative recombinase)
MIRVKTPSDWIITYGGMTALLDTKTTLGDSFPHSKIEPHQVEEMLLHSQSGAKSGYVIWMRKTDDIIFCSSALLASLLGKRGSIPAPLNGGSNYLGKSALFRPKMIFGNH